MEPVEQLYQNIGSLIRSAREHLKLTQQELGERVGLKRSSITNLEQGRQRIQIHTLFALAEALKVSPQVLIPQLKGHDTLNIDDDLFVDLSEKEQAWVRTVLAFEERGIRFEVKRKQKSKLAAKDGSIKARAAEGGLPVPIEDIARELGAQIRYAPYKGKVAGFIFQDKDNLIIGVNSLQAKTRQRFTIAHLIGYWVYDRHLGLHFDREFILPGIEQFPKGGSKELRACRFASATLVPEKKLTADLGGELIDYEDDKRIGDLAEQYGVSEQLMLFVLCIEQLIVI